MNRNEERLWKYSEDGNIKMIKKIFTPIPTSKYFFPRALFYFPRLINGHINNIKYNIYNRETLSYCFKLACKNGYLDIVTYFCELCVNDKSHRPIEDITAGAEWACEYGQFEILKYICELYKTNQYYHPIKLNNFYYKKCEKMSYLKSNPPKIRIDIEYNYDVAISVCEKGYYDIFKYLCELYMYDDSYEKMNTDGFKSFWYKCYIAALHNPYANTLPPTPNKEYIVGRDNIRKYIIKITSSTYKNESYYSRLLLEPIQCPKLTAPKLII